MQTADIKAQIAHLKGLKPMTSAQGIYRNMTLARLLLQLEGVR